MKPVASPSCHVLRHTSKRALEAFFDERAFIEVDAPILVVTPGTEVHLSYFASAWQDYRAQVHPMFLRSSPELHLKQAMAQGLGKVWHLGKCFRNQGELAAWHHPEFTMLEWYQKGIELEHLMEQTEELIHHVAAALGPDRAVFALPKHFTRISMTEAFKEFAQLDLVDGDAGLTRRAKDAGIQSVKADDDFETAFFKILIEKIEPALHHLGAVFLHGYPASQAALATVRGTIAERFELYLDGIEVCNAFHELTDATEARRRFQDTSRRRAALGAVRVPEDPEFFAALDAGLPQSCGNALGFDRLLGVLIGATSMDSVIPFRTMAPYHLGYHP